MGVDALPALVIATAFVFEFTNGFHDTANAIATSVSTRALSPRAAVLLAAVMNLAGALVSTAVAKTVASGIIESSAVTQDVLLAALGGAIVWNLLTWLVGLPSSSTHALIGGLIGAALADSGSSAVQWENILDKVVVPGLLSPIVGFAAAFVLMLAVYRLFARSRPARVHHGFRLAQIASGSFVAFSHGANDAQKTMGVVTLALFVDGRVSSPTAIPEWVVVVCAAMMALGTYAGGWRIIRTIGQRVFKLDPPHGFAAQTGAALVLLATAEIGTPVSTTHVISGAIFGVGSTRRLSAVRWGLARDIVAGWALTIPVSAVLAAALALVFEAF